jgi:hypothetical protein
MAEWLTEFTSAYRSTILELKTLRRQEVQEQNKVTKQRLQRNFDKNMKKSIKRVFANNTGTETAALAVLQDPATGQLFVKPEDKLQHLHDQTAKLCSPVFGPKAGHFLPNDAPRRYPWNQPNCPDPFELTRLDTTEMRNKMLYSAMSDKNTFDEIINHLARGKQPGPDGVHNEMLQCLPDDTKSALHQFLYLQHVMATTVSALKTSNTVLLYKKGDATLYSNYRPIALANTTGKLYTAMLATAIATHCEDHNALHNSQEGFRKNRNTIRQIQTVVSAIEDAALGHQNLYVGYIDYSSAFNTIDHDKLMIIMHDIGIPYDGIEAVKSLYDNSTTTITTHFGKTAPIAINRGTIQGDTLSPLLFIIFLEPLLRWLHVGGRGYRLGCLAPNECYKYLGVDLCLTLSLRKR